MKEIPFKTKQRYALKFPTSGPHQDRPYPSRHFQNNFATEQLEITRGISKQQLAALPAGIHVIYQSGGNKLIQKEIQRVYGRNITTPVSASTLRELKKRKVNGKNN